MSATADICAMLKVRYPTPEWALFFEVADATGSSGRRYADAVAMNMFPSRGLAINGFEVKVYRSDWLRELKDPLKSAAVQQFCDFWWVVADKDVVKEEEVPEAWGFIERHGAKLFQVKKAPKLEARPITRSFAASMIRRAGEADDEAINARVNVAVKAESDRIRAEYKQRQEMESRSYTNLRKEVEEFETASGISIKHYSGRKLGEQVRELFLSYTTLPYRLKNLRTSIEGLLRDADKACGEFGLQEQEQET